MNNHNHNLKIQDQEKSIYACPMHPEIKQDKPGSCPKCGMRLVKNETKIDDSAHVGHAIEDTSKMGFWEKFKMSMSVRYPILKTIIPGNYFNFNLNNFSSQIL